MSRPTNAALLAETLRTVAFVHAAGRPVTSDELAELNGWSERQRADRLARCTTVLVDELGLLAIDGDGHFVPAGSSPTMVRLPAADDAVGQLLLCDIGLAVPALQRHHDMLRAVRERLARLLGVAVATEIDTPPSVAVLFAAADNGRQVAFRYRAVDGDENELSVLPTRPWLAAGEWRFQAVIVGSDKAYTFRADRIIGEVTPIDDGEPSPPPTGEVVVQSVPRHRVSLLCAPDDLAVFDRFAPLLSTAGPRFRVDLDLFEPVEEVFAVAVQGCLSPVEVVTQPDGLHLEAVQATVAARIAADHATGHR